MRIVAIDETSLARIGQWPWPRDRLAELVGKLAAAGAVSIAALGLFALSAFTTERRTKEIGIRKVMGASTFDVVRLLMWQFTVPVLWAMAIALPIGLLSAIYLSEYAPRRLRMLLKPSLELLAGVPTIVYGYLALLLVTPALKALLEPMGVRVDQYNALSGCIVVGVMIIPLVSSLSEDVLSAVPRGLREAAFGLGATKFEVSTRIVLPAALSGVVASFILAISRAIGETMAVVLAAGLRPQISTNLLSSVETMTAYIVSVTGGEASYGSPEYLSLFAVGMALFLMTLALNILSGLVLRRYREVYQ